MAEENLEQITFPRQRRNLFVVSAALIAAMYTNLTINQIGFFGNQLTLDTPKTISGFLWWLWGYWFIRFVQAFVEIPDRGILNAYAAKHRALLASSGSRKLIKEHPKIFDPQRYPPDSETAIAPPAFLTSKRNKVALRYDISVSHFEDGLQIAGNNAGQEIVVLSGVELLKPRILAFLWVTICTTKATEYFLPFLVGFAPIVYWLLVIGRSL